MFAFHKLVRLTLAGLCAFSIAAHAADQYPSTTIKVIVPFPPGATADIMIRTIAPRLGERLGQAIVIENRAGGSGIAAAEIVAKATADGYTLLFDGVNHVTNVGLFAHLPFSVSKDFSAVSYVGNVQTILVAYPGTGFKTVGALAKAAKARPGVLDFGSAGNGTAGHMSMELLARAAGISLTHIPYKGATPALTALMSGQIQVLYTGLPPTLSLIQSGMIVPLVVSGAKRAPTLPNVPSMADIGMLKEDVETWFGLFGPAGLPDAIADKLSKTIAAVVKEPKVAALLAAQGVNPIGSTPQAFAAVVDRDLKRWPPLIRSLGIKPQ
jgi:tripartite-type tricarboxylate transporter receptor subunit TctC